ncbi:ankyrin repeat domain-containing protein [uncultured Parvibaculum sp.]|uniref:ankyrin repeat domain-containing protein n=1 Tax=uncultured Parvibaculum sp. TaxID=291828 RepID=UPI0030DA8D71
MTRMATSGLFRPIMALMLAAPLALAALSDARAVPPGGPTNYMVDNDTVHAARTGDIEKLRTDLMKGVTPNEAGRDRIPMLILAVGNGHLAVVELLLEKGADPNRRAPDGTTPLTMAAATGRADIAEVLLQGGADPNGLGPNRDAPLLIATRARNTAFVEALIRHNADLGETDLTGRTALMLAEENHYREIAALLRAAGAY